MKLPFDKIYCLQLAENKDRYNENQKQFASVGILDQVEYWWTCRRSFANDCASVCPNMISGFYDMIALQNPNTYGSVFNCAIEHYTIIKQSLLRGFEHILIFEDDISFNVNEEQFDIAMSNLPENYDLVLFQNNHRLEHCTDTFYPISNELCANYFQVKTPSDKWPQKGTMMYAINKRMMKFIIDYFDTRGLSYSDRFLYIADRLEYNIYEPFCKIVEPKGYSSINEDLYK